MIEIPRVAGYVPLVNYVVPLSVLFAKVSTDHNPHPPPELEWQYW